MTVAAPILQNLSCRSCGAALEVEPEWLTHQCPYCASPQVIEVPPEPGRPRPTLAMPFVITGEQARVSAHRWIKGRLFAPSAFRKAEAAEIRGVYLPAYLYSAVARSEWSAEIGENYTVTETYTTTNSQGKTVTRTRTKVKTEWRSLQGRHAEYVDDVVVTASKGLTNPELEGVEPFDLGALRRYGPELVSGWIAERPTLTEAECLALSREEARVAVGRRLAGRMPGDSHRGLNHATQLDTEDLELALVPVWVFPVRWHPERPLVRLVVNGQTGRASGKAPTSWLKITLTVLGVAAVVLAAAFGLGVFS